LSIGGATTERKEKPKQEKENQSYETPDNYGKWALISSSPAPEVCPAEHALTKTRNNQLKEES
jgi:hypothetical protein